MLAREDAKVFLTDIDDEAGKEVARHINEDLKGEASYTNKIGSAQLLAYWQDPDFDASSPAFYYARVLEIPTPRWTAYDAAYFNQDLPDEIPLWQQERAYSSPIWFRP